MDLKNLIKHILHMTFTEKDLKKFADKRKRVGENATWIMPLDNDWNERTREKLDIAREYFESEEVQKIMSGKSRLIFNLQKNPLFPAAEYSEGKTIVNAYYILAAVGQLFPEESLRYNRDCLLFTLAHEKNHIKTKLVGVSMGEFGHWCEECRSDIMASRNLKDLRGDDITCDYYIEKIMKGREKFTGHPDRHEENHPSRVFRTSIVKTGAWNEYTIDKIADEFCKCKGKRKTEIQKSISAVKSVYYQRNDFDLP